MEEGGRLRRPPPASSSGDEAAKPEPKDPMRTLRNKTAKSARRKLGLALLIVAAVCGAGAYAVFAAGAQPDYSIAASPASQAVSKGQAATYKVSLTRRNGFAGSVRLRAANLPSGATASWKLSDGTNSNVVPPGVSWATLTIKTGSNTPNGTSSLKIEGTSGNLKHATTVKLVVQPATQPNFALAATPASRSLLPGEGTTYSVKVNRTGGFGGPVNLSVAGLPSGATAAWAPSRTVPGTSSGATLEIELAGSANPGSHNLVITGTGTVKGHAASRLAAVMLIVQESQELQIAGNLGAGLAPGMKAPLNLTLSNPNNFAVKVTDLTVAVEEGTSQAGCSGTQNFAITQTAAARYPITVPAGQTRTLTQLGVADGDKPQVEMLNLPSNQDACKSATITLDYGGSARK